jgi:hypothetical protein
MGWFFDLLLLAGLAVWVAAWAAAGGATAETAGVILLGLVFLIAVARAVGGLIRLAFRVGIPVVLLYLFFRQYGQGDPETLTALAGMAMLLALVLFGFYVMFGGLRKREP